MTPATDAEVATSLARLGNYRVRRAQFVANAGAPDGISGALLLALGLRETWGRNIEGGAKWSEAQKRWVALDPKVPADAARMDVSWLQISRIYHADALRLMPAVEAGTWDKSAPLHSPAEGGYVPRFEEALQFTLLELHESIAFGHDHHVKGADVVRFAIAAHNAGVYGALLGYQEGNVDLKTAGGDYSAWVLDARGTVNSWLHAHPNWLVRP